MRATLHVIMVCQKDGKWLMALPTRSTIDVVGMRLTDTVNKAVKRWMDDHFRVKPNRIQSFEWGKNTTIAVAEVEGDSIDALLKTSGERRVWHLLDHSEGDARVAVRYACRNTFLGG